MLTLLLLTLLYGLCEGSRSHKSEIRDIDNKLTSLLELVVSLEDQFNAVEQQYIDFNIEAASGDMGYGWEEPVEMSMMSEMRAEESPAELREKECGRKFKNCMPIQEGIEGSGSNFKQIITCTEKNYFLAQVAYKVDGSGIGTLMGSCCKKK